MSGISSPGVGSGLPIADLVSQLVSAEITPLKERINLRGARMSTELSALGQVKSALSKLQDTLIKLSDIQQFYGVSAKISDTSILSAKLDEKARTGTYEIQVEQLATRHTLASASIANPSASLGSGTLHIEFGSYNGDKSAFTANATQAALSIDIDDTANSLEAIRDKINASDSGLSASIISDSQGARLTLSSLHTGENVAMRINVSNNGEPTGLSALAYDPTENIEEMSETIAAQNNLTRINGLLLDNDSNELKHAIEGISLNLNKADPNTTVRLDITQDKSKMVEGVNQFIKQYNETMSVLNNFTGYDAATETAGYLQGDSALRSLKNAMARWVGQSLNHPGSSLQSIADIGIRTNRQGLLEINLEKFNDVLEHQFAEMGALFAKTAVSTDENIRVQQVGREVPAGKYPVNIDSFIPGSELFGQIGGVYANSSDGRVLQGTGIFHGVQLEVLAGTTGDRGQIEIRDGLAVMFDDILESFLGTQGNLTSRTEQLGKRIADLDKERSTLEMRANKIEERYMRQFTALDALISQMQTTSQFLTQQLAILPDLRIKSR
ncbi:MAG: flagellar filament capping protein FliD [Legionellaceae bacterium]|nr:flagellar filament capping protein FliD [Legionellaceae bacterium]